MPVMDLLFSRIADVVDFEETLNCHNNANIKIREFVWEWFRIAMEMRWEYEGNEVELADAASNKAE